MANWREHPKSISAITLFVEDLDTAKAFYSDVLALPLVFEDDDSAVFSLAATLVNLLRVGAAAEVIEPATVAARSSGVRSLLTVPVDDVDEFAAELSARGVTLVNGPIDRPWGVRTACFEDPAGHLWEIAHRIV